MLPSAWAPSIKRPAGFPLDEGVVSLVGVIVSYLIVLFDFIEEAREKRGAVPERVASPAK